MENIQEIVRERAQSHEKVYALMSFVNKENLVEPQIVATNKPHNNKTKKKGINNFKLIEKRKLLPLSINKKKELLKAPIETMIDIR